MSQCRTWRGVARELLDLVLLDAARAHVNVVAFEGGNHREGARMETGVEGRSVHRVSSRNLCCPSISSIATLNGLWTPGRIKMSATLVSSSESQG